MEECGTAKAAVWTHRALQKIKLPDDMGLDPGYVLPCRETLLNAGIRTAADVATMPFEAFLEPDKNLRHRTLYLSLVIKYMMAQGMTFLDLDPAQAFKTEIKRDDPLITTRTYNSLLRHGLCWVEILPYFTEAALMRIYGFGILARDQVCAILERQGLSFRPADGQ